MSFRVKPIFLASTAFKGKLLHFEEILHQQPAESNKIDLSGHQLFNNPAYCHVENIKLLRDRQHV